MKKLEPYPIATALFFIFTTLYIVCIGIKLLLVGFGIEGIWHMHEIWKYFLPGFNGLSSLSILVGLIEVSLGSYFLGYIIVPVYNYLAQPNKPEKIYQASPIKIRFATLFSTLSIYTGILSLRASEAPLATCGRSGSSSPKAAVPIVAAISRAKVACRVLSDMTTERRIHRG